MINVVTLFSGYDSQCLALDRLKAMHPDFDYDLVAWSEIDKYAIAAHNAIYPQWADRNLGDVSTIDWESFEPRIDLLTYSFPCTDISAAGRQQGLSAGSGTRSSLLWECERVIAAKRPKVLLMENVKALVQKKFMPDFQRWQDLLAHYGYNNFRTVMNAKNYGVPQNRERVFMISKLGGGGYAFPKPFELTRKLKDVLEDNVDEKYYISDKALEYFKRVGADTSHNHNFEPTDWSGTSHTIGTMTSGRVDGTFIEE